MKTKSIALKNISALSNLDIRFIIRRVGGSHNTEDTNEIKSVGF
jgi:hypothetical protein